MALAFQDQGLSPGSGESAPSLNIFSLLKDADHLVQVVLLILLAFSAAAWGIIVYKRRQFHRSRQQTRAFLELFRKSTRFAEVHGACEKLSASPLVGLFLAGYAEINAQLRAVGDAKPDVPAPRPILKSLDALDRALIRASTVEVAKLEHRVPFLATTASITPYIGLFGTVWGILTSFMRIASAGATSLGVVAPGIAEALIATAAGLFAAIPAVYFYNDLTSQVKAAVNEMEDFSMEFLTIAERNFT
jgi:biopolymer transport protein TolQ